MPIASYKPTATPVPASMDPSQQLSRTQAYHTASVDNAVVAPASLLVNLDGMPWAVDYFNQLIDSSDDIREVDIGQNAALQQYQAIKNLEFRVQAELTSNYDTDSALTTVTGSAIVVQVVPLKYDYFVTDVGDREKGLFMINNVSQKTYNNKSVHEVEYTLIGYITSPACKDRWEALQARAVREFFFHKENIAQGGSPLLTLEDHYNAENLRLAALTILESYFATFASMADGVMLAPYGVERYVDVRLLDFILKTVNTREAPPVQFLQVVSKDKDPFLNKPSLWTAIIEQQSFHLKSSLNKVAIMPKLGFGSRAAFITGAFSWCVDGFFYPAFGDDNQAQAQLSGHWHPTYDPRQLTIAVAPEADNAAYCASAGNKVMVAGVELPVIKPAHSDGYYVLSEAFYKGTSDLSLLEILVRDLTENKPLKISDVLVLVNHYERWPLMEKFYYGPILVTMIRHVTHGFY